MATISSRNQNLSDCVTNIIDLMNRRLQTTKTMDEADIEVVVRSIAAMLRPSVSQRTARLIRDVQGVDGMNKNGKLFFHRDAISVLM
jgi:hypothetical protein